MNEMNTWNKYINSQGIQRYEHYLELMNLASSQQLSDTLMHQLIKSLDDQTPSQVMIALHMLSKQAIFQSNMINCEVLLNTLNKILFFKPIYVHQMIETLVGFVAHDQCSLPLITWSLVQYNQAIESNQESITNSFLKTFQAIKRTHPTANGIEHINDLLNHNDIKKG
jgi:hypothetical protein